MNNFRLVFKNTLFLTFSEFFLKVVGVIWVIFLAQSLTVAEYGKYTLVNSFVGIFAFLPDLGIGLIVVREIAKNRKKANLYLGNSLLLNVFFAFVTLLTILLIKRWIIPSPSTDYLIFIASLTLFFSIIRTAPVFYFEGTERMGIAAILTSLNTVLLLFGAFVLFEFGLGLPGIFWGMLLGTILSIIIAWVLMVKYVIPKVKFEKKLATYFLLQGLPLGMAAFASLVYSNVDSVILGRMLGDRSVGLYNAATPFAFSLIQLLNVPFVMAIYPALTRIGRKNPKRFNRAVLKSLGVIALWSFPIAIFVSLASPIFVPLIFGHKYDSAIPILKILVFFVPFASLSALLYKVLIVIKKQKTYLIVSLIGAAINIVLNLVLIPMWGIYGAAFTEIITQFVLFVIYSIVVYIFLKI